MFVLAIAILVATLVIATIALVLVLRVTPVVNDLSTTVSNNSQARVDQQSCLAVAQAGWDSAIGGLVKALAEEPVDRGHVDAAVRRVDAATAEVDRSSTSCFSSTTTTTTTVNKG